MRVERAAVAIEERFRSRDRGSEIVLPDPAVAAAILQRVELREAERVALEHLRVAGIPVLLEIRSRRLDLQLEGFARIPFQGEPADELIFTRPVAMGGRRN